MRILSNLKTSNNHWIWLLWLAVIIMLLPAVFTSIEFCDTGFYTTFYDNFFKAPQNVEYNFMYYLTGPLGGLVEGLNPTGGLIRLRILGIILLLGSFSIVWIYCRNVVNPKLCFLALLCVAAGYISYPIILSYDLLSVFILVDALLLLTRGISLNRTFFIFSAAFLLGILPFVRIPNILLFSLGILIPIYLQSPSKEKWIQIGWFITGYITGVCAVIILMLCLGHVQIFIDNISTLFLIASDSNASHGAGNIIFSQLRYYYLLLMPALKIYIIIAGVGFIWSLLKSFWIKIILTLPFVLYLGYMAFFTPPVILIGAFSLPMLIYSIYRNGFRKESLLCGAALLSSIILPVGSDWGGSNIGSILYMACLPLAFAEVLKLRFFIRRKTVFFPSYFLTTVSIMFIGINIFKGYSQGFYFDNTPIWEMTATSSSPKLKYIRMSQQRAEIIDNSLDLLNRYVEDGDTLFVYGSSPLINYLTSTKPFLNNSWPEQLSPSLFRLLLEKEREEGNFPVVCVQKFKTIGPELGVPSEDFKVGLNADSNIYHNAGKWKIMEDFLRNNNYNMVDSTSHYEIYMR